MDSLTGGDDGTVTPATAETTTDIVGLTADSRQVRPGFLFAALPGARADGRAYIAEAVKRGAAAVLGPLDVGLDDPHVALIRDSNPRRRFALMAARFHGRQPRHAVAVTGTNGKTSTVSFARQIWTRLGRAAASLGTLGIEAPGFSLKGSHTTPDPVALHGALKDLAERGVEHVAMEASSHGLDQHRLDGVRLAAAAFTNLSRDHLDYHPDMAAYLAAKRRLFTELLPAEGTAVLNADTPEFAELLRACRQRGLRVWSYGAQGEDLRIEAADPVGDGQNLSLRIFGRRHEILLPLAGAFQAGNALAALGLVIATGEDAEAATEALAHLTGVPGRMQRVARLANGAAVYVDYAHSPDALETVLGALRPHARRLRVVFGCGGDRDPGKRPVMGLIAARLAERVIVTDDNPRSEDPATIRQQIRIGCPDALEIADRAEAIRHAIERLGAEEVLLIAGKGHETGQIVGDKVLPFDDAEVARAVIAKLEGRS